MKKNTINEAIYDKASMIASADMFTAEDYEKARERIENLKYRLHETAENYEDIYTLMDNIIEELNEDEDKLMELLED
jgi:flagellar capping protein FliD